MEVTGKITKVLDKETGQKKDGSGEWVKQSFVLKTDEQYNNLYCFEIFGAEKVDKFNQYNKVGSTVKVDFNVQTNEWNGKYYTTLQAWKVFKEDAQSAPLPAEPFSPAGDLNEEEDDGLPF